MEFETPQTIAWKRFSPARLPPAPSMERAVRAWATFDPQAKAAVEAVDAERIRYLRKLLDDAGIPPETAETRARIMNWAYLGFALSSTRLDDETLKGVVDGPVRSSRA